MNNNELSNAAEKRLLHEKAGEFVSSKIRPISTSTKNRFILGVERESLVKVFTETYGLNEKGISMLRAGEILAHHIQLQHYPYFRRWIHPVSNTRISFWCLELVDVPPSAPLYVILQSTPKPPNRPLQNECNGVFNK